MARKSSKPIFLKIGDACKKLDIAPYVLRYWETEFPSLAPKKSRSGQRVYGDKELKVIGRIKELLHEECYTIAGAKKKLEAELATGWPENGEAPARAGDDVVPELSSKAFQEAVDQAARSAVSTKWKALRVEVTGALGEAREILEMLESPSTSR